MLYVSDAHGGPLHLFDPPAGGPLKLSHTPDPLTQARYHLSPVEGGTGVIFALFPLQAFSSLHFSTTFFAVPVSVKSVQAFPPKHSIKHFESPGLLQVMTELPLQASVLEHWMRHPSESTHVYDVSCAVIIFVVNARAVCRLSKDAQVTARRTAAGRRREGWCMVLTSTPPPSHVRQ